MGNFKGWIGGMISAACGAASGTIGAGMVDPNDFNIGTHEGRHKLLLMALYSALVPVLTYLKQSPLPGIDPTLVTTTTATAVSRPAPNTVLVETTEQVKTEAAKKDG